MSKRPLLIGGLVVAGGAGYYLYSAGGDPKAAQKQFESDASRATAKLKGELPGDLTTAKKEGEEAAARVGAKFDSAVGDARSKAEQLKSEGTSKFEQARKETGTELTKAIDKLDKTVEEKTAKAKSGISSWFGGGK